MLCHGTRGTVPPGGHWREHSSLPPRRPPRHPRSQLRALLSATIHTISSQTRNRCSCCLLIRQSLKPRGSGIAGPGVGAHPFAKDKDNREPSFYGSLQGIRVFSAPTEEQTQTPLSTTASHFITPFLTAVQPAALPRNIHSFFESEGLPFVFYRERKVLRTSTIISTLTTWGKENSRS